MRIIPAIDILDGKCVRLTQGDYKDVKIYEEDPLRMAQKMEALGVKYLHVVDLDGAKSQGVVNYATVERICKETNLKVDFGGGIKSEMDVKRMFNCGVSQITVGSLAVRESGMVQKWMEKYGPDKIILGADCRNRKIAISGWLETTELQLDDFIEMYVPYGLKYLICTDISKDGLLQGAAVELYKQILKKFPTLCLIASGGVRNEEDLIELGQIGCEGAIVGKALYEGSLPWEKLKELC